MRGALFSLTSCALLALTACGTAQDHAKSQHTDATPAATTPAATTAAAPTATPPGEIVARVPLTKTDSTSLADVEFAALKSGTQPEDNAALAAAFTDATQHIDIGNAKMTLVDSTTAAKSSALSGDTAAGGGAALCGYGCGGEGLPLFPILGGILRGVGQIIAGTVNTIAAVLPIYHPYYWGAASYASYGYSNYADYQGYRYYQYPVVNPGVSPIGYDPTAYPGQPYAPGYDPATAYTGQVNPYAPYTPGYDPTVYNGQVNPYAPGYAPTTTCPGQVNPYAPGYVPVTTTYTGQTPYTQGYVPVTTSYTGQANAYAPGCIPATTYP